MTFNRLQSTGSSREEAERWVANNGNDSNIGTYSRPLKNIQTAVDELDENYGPQTTKTVKLKIGDTSNYEKYFPGPVFINSGRWNIIGEKTGSHLGDSPVIYMNYNQNFTDLLDGTTEEDGSIPFIFTNMTRSSWDQYITDGGISFNEDSTNGTFSYTGASLQSRNINTDFYIDTWDGNKAFFDAQVYVENIDFITYATPGPSYGFAVIPAVYDSRPYTYFYSIGFSGGNVGSFADHYGYVKSVEGPSFQRFGGHGSEQELVLDNVDDAEITGHRSDQSDRYQLVANRDNTTQNGNIQDNRNRIFEDESLDPSMSYKAIRFYSTYTGDNRINFKDSQNIRVRGPGLEMYGNASLSCGWNQGGNFIGRVETGNCKLDTSGIITVDDFFTRGMDKTGSGDMRINSIRSEINDVTIQNGTVNEIRGGYSEQDIILKGGCGFDLSDIVVDTDVVVEGGATGTLNGLEIKGDLIVRNSGTQVDCRGVYVQGAVQLETDLDQTINFYEGSVIGEGYTNPIRDENGNDRSGDAVWNRVTGV